MSFINPAQPGATGPTAQTSGQAEAAPVAQQHTAPSNVINASIPAPNAQVANKAKGTWMATGPSAAAKQVSVNQTSTIHATPPPNPKTVQVVGQVAGKTLPQAAKTPDTPKIYKEDHFSTNEIFKQGIEQGKWSPPPSAQTPDPRLRSREDDWTSISEVNRIGDERAKAASTAQTPGPDRAQTTAKKELPTTPRPPEDTGMVTNKSTKKWVGNVFADKYTHYFGDTAVKLSKLSKPDQKHLERSFRGLDNMRTTVTAALDFKPADKKHVGNISDNLCYFDNYVKAGPDNYLNASPMEFGGVKYLAAEGAHAKTALNFFQALIETDTETIVTLNTTDPWDNGRNKDLTLPILADPDHSAPLELMDGSDPPNHIYTVTRGKEEVLFQEHYPDNSPNINPDGGKIVKRNLEIKDTKGNTIKTITQFHYINWKDMSTPTSTEAMNFLQDSLDKAIEGKNKPVLVHCRAGLGRTGTFIAAHSINREIKKAANGSKVDKDFKVDIEKRIFDMRLYRDGMVQKIDQLGAIYDSVLATKKQLKKSK